MSLKKIGQQERTKSFADVDSNVLLGFEDFAHVDLNDMEIPFMSSHGFNIYPNNVTRPSRASDSRTCSSDSKRKRKGHNLETIDVIKDAMVCQTDQLRLIVSGCVWHSRMK